MTLSPVFDAGIFAVLPNRDRQGRVVVLFFPGRHRLCEIPFDHMLRACVYVLERAVRSAETQVNGIVLLEDFDGFTLKQALGLKARDLKNLVTLAQVRELGCCVMLWIGRECADRKGEREMG